MNKSTYILETKPSSGKRGERIHKCVSYSLSEAIDMLLKLKDARIHTYDEIKMYDTITDMLIDCKTEWSENKESLRKELKEKYFRSLSHGA